MVREKNDGLQTTFVLSYLDKKGSINHFQIKAICGDYYIAGEKFPSLKHLIGYYTKYCDLLKNEKLIFPVPPIEVNAKCFQLFVCNKFLFCFILLVHLFFTLQFRNRTRKSRNSSLLCHITKCRTPMS